MLQQITKKVKKIDSRMKASQLRRYKSIPSHVMEVKDIVSSGGASKRQRYFLSKDSLG